MKQSYHDYLLGLDNQYYLQVYKRFPLAFKKGKGVYVWDFNNKKYLDAFAGIAVNCLGYTHPVLNKRIIKQLKKLGHTSNFFVNEPQVLLAEKLCKLSGLDRAFFANSGAEANEGAFKLARKYAHSKGKGGVIISLDNCFHGRTLATIASGKKKYQQGFEPIPQGFAQVPFNDINALELAITNDVAAIIIEPIQGEGGIHICDKDYLKAVRALCDKNDVLLVFDEVQCGVGRTGTFFAYEQFGVKPDIVTLAKGLGGGIAIGAVVCKQTVADAIQYGDHGTTFGGNAIAAAAALSVIKIIEKDEILQNVQKLGAWFVNELQQLKEKYPLIVTIRAIGFMIGVELSIEGRELVSKMMAKGVLANVTADTTIRFVPPLIINKKQLKKVLDVFEESLKEVSNG
jgi:acetylornithine/N-succinyldiaminopimelate aminotransferase